MSDQISTFMALLYPSGRRRKRPTGRRDQGGAKGAGSSRRSSSLGGAQGGAIALGQRARRRGAYIERRGPDQAVVGRLLGYGCGPTHGTAAGEHGREHVAGNSNAVPDHSGVELDVRVETPARLELGENAQRGGLDMPRELHLITPHLGGNLAEQRRAGVVGLVHAMTEAHQPLTSPDLGAQILLGS